MRNMRGGTNTTGLEELVGYLPKGLEVIEVGSYAGESAEIFARTAKIVWCIDSWEGYAQEAEKEFDERVKDLKNVLKIKMDSTEIGKDADFIYIDAEHDYESVKRDIEQWLPHARQYIGGHDYKDKFPGVIQAVNEHFTPDKVFPDSSWLKKL